MKNKILDFIKTVAIYGLFLVAMITFSIFLIAAIKGIAIFIFGAEY